MNILEILYCFIEHEHATAYGPRDVAKLVDYNIAHKLEQGMPLEEAVP